jgi:hypothetical protein
MAAAEAGADFVIGVRRTSARCTRRIAGWCRGVRARVRALGAPGIGVDQAGAALLHRAVVSRGVFAEGEQVIRAARGEAGGQGSGRVHRAAQGDRGARRGGARGARRRVAASLALGAGAATVPDVER